MSYAYEGEKTIVALPRTVKVTGKIPGSLRAADITMEKNASEPELDSCWLSLSIRLQRV